MSLSCDNTTTILGIVNPWISYLWFTIRNHGLFEWKSKPKINHFDIWSIWPFNHIGQVDLNMSNLIDGFFY
jgi:hypothetical protein